jgi:hypothetical protein
MKNLMKFIFKPKNDNSKVDSKKGKVAKNTKIIDNLRALYHSNSEFIENILHLRLFKTGMYYEKEMKHFSILQISKELNLEFFMLRDVTSHSFENGEFKFELKMGGFLSLPVEIPFPELFNTLISECNSPENVEDMYDKMYKSKNSRLIKLAEEFKNKEIELSSELFNFIKRKECDTKFDWKLDDLLNGNWNYNLLALNENVWEKAFESEYLNQLFENEKSEFALINANKSHKIGYANHLNKMYNINNEKLK